MASRHMSLSEFFKTVEWQRLSMPQKFWLRTYLASGNDRLFATHSAYATSGENARTFSYHIVRQKKIQAALNRYFNKSPRELFLDQLQADIKAGKPGSAARARLQVLYARVACGIKSSKIRRKREHHDEPTQEVEQK
jgi:hypothetical protein